MPYGAGNGDKSSQFFTMQGQPVYRQAIEKMVQATTRALEQAVLAHGVACGALHAGDRVVLTAFGGGLTWGSTLLRWPEITCGN
jgi:3-oxoacyl-[acyl-carrier-protein] synthase III